MPPAFTVAVKMRPASDEFLSELLRRCAVDGGLLASDVATGFGRADIGVLVGWADPELVASDRRTEVGFRAGCGGSLWLGGSLLTGLPVTTDSARLVTVPLVLGAIPALPLKLRASSWLAAANSSLTRWWPCWTAATICWTSEFSGAAASAEGCGAFCPWT